MDYQIYCGRIFISPLPNPPHQREGKIKQNPSRKKKKFSKNFPSLGGLPVGRHGRG